MAAKKSKRTNKKSTKTKKQKTTKGETTTPRKKVIKGKKDDKSSSFRVYEISSILKDAVGQRRTGQTIRSLIREAVLDEKTGVAHIVSELHSLGLGHETGPENTSKVRYEIDNDILAKLRLGAATSKCSACHLLLAALQCHLSKKGCE